MSETAWELRERKKKQIVELMDLSREDPAMQAEIGWRCLMTAWMAGIGTYGELLDKIEKKNETEE